MTRSLRSVVLAAQGALLAALVLVGGVVALRRLAGELLLPLGTTALAATGLAFAAACLVGRLIGTRLLSARRSPWHELISRLGPLAASVLLLFGVLLPSSSLVGACFLVALLAAEETWCATALPWQWRPFAWAWGQGHEHKLHDPATASSVASFVPKLASEPLLHGSAVHPADQPEDESPEESVDQQVTRRSRDGEDRLDGYARVRFAAGQRTAEAHVAFCPPFARSPQVEFEALSGPAARIELGQVLPLGVRWDLKLAQGAQQETSVLLHFSAAVSAGKDDRSARCA